MTERTTDLGVIRTNPRRFTWGKVEHIHDVGRYTIVEHMDYPPFNAGRESGRSFHVYVDGKDTRNAAESLDKAMLLAWVNASQVTVTDARMVALGKALATLREQT